MNPYADREAALATLTELLEQEPPESALTLLDAATGTRDEATVYRPHYAAALTLTAATKLRVIEAKGTKFTNPMDLIRHLLAQQAIWDAQLDVPEEWTVATALARLTPGRSIGSRLAHARMGS